MVYARLILPILLVSVLLFSCTSAPKESAEEPVVTVTQTTITEETFDRTQISREQYDVTMEEVQGFIDGLNMIIRNKNFTAWKSALSAEYLAEISAPNNLREMSERPAMKTRKIILKSVEDYFNHVVVPSRADLHVDDIEFISKNRVKAFSVSTNKAGEEQRLRLYDLEKIGNTWTIIN